MGGARTRNSQVERRDDKTVDDMPLDRCHRPHPDLGCRDLVGLHSMPVGIHELWN